MYTNTLKFQFVFLNTSTHFSLSAQSPSTHHTPQEWYILYTLTTGVVPGRAVVVVVAVWAERRGEGVGREEGMVETVDWATA